MRRLAFHFMRIGLPPCNANCWYNRKTRDALVVTDINFGILGMGHSPKSVAMDIFKQYSRKS